MKCYMCSKLQLQRYRDMKETNPESSDYIEIFGLIIVIKTKKS